MNAYIERERKKADCAMSQSSFEEKRSLMGCSLSLSLSDAGTQVVYATERQRTMNL